jgi:hypothetical protein
MTKTRLAWLVMISTLVLGGGVGVLACSEAGTGDDVPADTDSGVKVDAGSKDSGMPDSTVPDGGTTTDEGGTTTDSGAGGCFAKLRPSADKGVFCPFVPKGDGGTGVNCAQTETCCSGGGKPDGGGFDPSSCVVGAADKCAAASPGAAPTQAFECTQKADCASKGAGVCCVISNGSDAGVGFATSNTTSCNIFTRESGTRCKATCGAGEVQGCQADTDCPAGKTCTLANAGSGDRIDMGYCK